MAEDKPVKPKVTLEDVVKTAAAYQSISPVAERHTYDSDMSSFYNYLSVKGKDPSEIPGIGLLGKNPLRFSQLMGITAENERKDLVAKTEAALGEVCGKFDQKATTGLAVKLALSKDKDYSFYASALQNQDAGSVKAVYMAKYKDDALLMSYAQTASEEDFLDYAGVQARKIENKFVQKNLYTEETVIKDGKPVKALKYDSQKAQKYLVSAISGLKGEEKEEVLVQLGSLAMQIVAQEKAKKAKEAAATKK